MEINPLTCKVVMRSEGIFDVDHCSMRSQVDEDGGDACKETNHGATYPLQPPPPLFFSSFFFPSINKGGSDARRSQETVM
jgi:hypothetical protein